MSLYKSKRVILIVLVSIICLFLYSNSCDQKNTDVDGSKFSSVLLQGIDSSSLAYTELFIQSIFDSIYLQRNPDHENSMPVFEFGRDHFKDKHSLHKFEFGDNSNIQLEWVKKDQMKLTINESSNIYQVVELSKSQNYIIKHISAYQQGYEYRKYKFYENIRMNSSVFDDCYHASIF